MSTTSRQHINDIGSHPNGAATEAPRHLPRVILVFIGWYGSTNRQRERFLKLYQYQTLGGEGKELEGNRNIYLSEGGVIPQEPSGCIFDIVVDTPVTKHFFNPEPFSKTLWKKVDNSCEKYYAIMKDSPSPQPPQIVFHLMSNNGAISLIHLNEYLKHKRGHEKEEKQSQPPVFEFGHHGDYGGYTDTFPDRYITSPTNPAVLQPCVCGIIIDSAPGNMLMYNGWKVISIPMSPTVKNSIIGGAAVVIAYVLYLYVYVVARALEGTPSDYSVLVIDVFIYIYYYAYITTLLVIIPSLVLGCFLALKQYEIWLTKEYHGRFTSACLGLIRDRSDCMFNGHNIGSTISTTDQCMQQHPKKFIQFLYGKEDAIIEKDAVEGAYRNICSSLQKLSSQSASTTDNCRQHEGEERERMRDLSSSSSPSVQMKIDSVLVSAHCFDASPHVAHFKTYPQKYRSIVTAVLKFL